MRAGTIAAFVVWCMSLVAMGVHSAENGSTAGAVPAKKYHCVYFVNGSLVDAAPLTIAGKGAYTDSEGQAGTYTVVAQTVTFRGGNYGGQRAEYESSGGRPRLHILGPSGRRVIDCD